MAGLSDGRDLSAMKLANVKAWAAIACILAAGLSGCRSSEGLAMLQVAVSSRVQPFTTYRFSVVNRPDLPERRVNRAAPRVRK